MSNLTSNAHETRLLDTEKSLLYVLWRNKDLFLFWRALKVTSHAHAPILHVPDSVHAHTHTFAHTHKCTYLQIYWVCVLVLKF